MRAQLRRRLSEAKWRVFRLIESLNLRASKVPNQPWLDPASFAWTASIENATASIIEELRQVQATRPIPNFQDISPEQRVLTDDDRWKTYFFYGYGHRDEANCSRCPETDRALRLIPGMRTAMFSILAAGKVLSPHRGPYNGVLRYHLGLVIPDDGTTSGIRVGDRTRHWGVGESLVFDDTFEHEAWNLADSERVVLFVDFARPLRAPVSLVNSLVLAAARRSRFVTDAIENLRQFEQAAAAEAERT